MIKLDGSGTVPTTPLENVWKTPWLLALVKFAPKNALLKYWLLLCWLPMLFGAVGVAVERTAGAGRMQTGTTANQYWVPPFRATFRPST